MPELIIALLMIVNGEIKEHRIQESMSNCLKGKSNNVVNIEFLKEQTSKLQEDVEKLIRNGNGH